MRFFKGLTIMFVICFCVLVSNSVNAKILWEKELILDANTNSAPLASCLNKDGNGIIVMTRECPKEEHPTFGGDLALWEIEIDGSATRTTPKDANGNRIWTNSITPGFSSGCAIVRDNPSNLLTIGILNKPGKNKQKIAVISKTDKAEKTMSIRNSIENYSMIKMIPLQDNSFVLVGKQNSNGSCLRIDDQGITMQEKLFDSDQTYVAHLFSGIDRIKSDDSNLALAIAGISFGTMCNDPNKNLSKNSVFICDANLKTIYEDHFAGGRAQLLFPKVCCLNNGNIAVLYKKENADLNKTLLWVRCYTKELKLLWDKEIFVADKKPSAIEAVIAMDITARESGGFTVGIIPYMVQRSNSLELDSFDNEGSKIEQVNYKGLISIAGFNLMHLNNKVIAVFEDGAPGNREGSTIKTKVIALD